MKPQQFKNPNSLEYAAHVLRVLCRPMAWYWKLHYSEIEDCYYAEAGSEARAIMPDGTPEFVEVKRASEPTDALISLTEKIYAWKSKYKV